MMASSLPGVNDSIEMSAQILRVFYRAELVIRIELRHAI